MILNIDVPSSSSPERVRGLIAAITQKPVDNLGDKQNPMKINLVRGNKADFDELIAAGIKAEREKN